jgi:hypothetical protein
LSKEDRKKELKSKIESLEKEILHLKGSRRTEARMEYFKLMKSCSKECWLDEPIYIMRY